MLNIRGCCVFLVAMPTLVGGAVAEDGPTQESAAYSDQTSLTEVVVTARRREENLYDIPVAVTAITGADIQAKGVDTVQGLYGDIPGLFFTDQGSPTTSDPSTYFFVMRGVGAEFVADPAVGVFIDGVYQPTVGVGQDIFGYDRMEVLRGPQGTSFGRNTEGGAINLVTRRPTQEWETTLDADVGQFNTFNASAYVGGPIAESLSGNLTLIGDSSDGYITNTYYGKPQMRDTAGKARGGLLWEFGGGAEMYATGFYETHSGPSMGLGVIGGCQCYDVSVDTINPNSYIAYGGSLIATLPLQSFQVRSLTGYSRSDTDAYEDVDGTAIFKGNFDRTQQGQRFTSEELRFESLAHSALTWAGGLYLEKDHRALYVDRQWPDFIGYDNLFNGTNLQGSDTTDTTSYAVFGDATYRFDSSYDLDVGARYSHEKASRTGGGFLDVPGWGGVISTFSSDGATTQSSAFTPKVSFSYHPTVSSTLYTSFSTGYKAGGFSAFPAGNAIDASFGPEKTNAFEIGAKGRFFDSRLSVAADVFYTQIRDQQVMVTVIVDGVPRSEFQNAARSKSQGAELEGSFAISAHWSVAVTGSYTDAYYIEYENANGYDLNGVHFPGVPTWLAHAELSYKHPVEGDKSFVGTLEGRYISAQPNDPSQLIDADNYLLPVPSSIVMNWRVGIESERWRALGYINNIANRYYITGAQYAKFTEDDPAYEYRVYERPGAPRTIGLRFEYRTK